MTTVMQTVSSRLSHLRRARLNVLEVTAAALSLADCKTARRAYPTAAPLCFAGFAWRTANAAGWRLTQRLYEMPLAWR
jgi:hypothetical protein